MRAFVGYGELAKQMIKISGDDTTHICFDDNLYSANALNSYPFQDWLSPKFSHLEFFISLGYRHLNLKRNLIQEGISRGLTLPSFIHPSCYLDSTAVVSSACFVYPMSNIDKDVVLKAGVILNNSVVVSHNTIIDECAYLSPGVIVSGNVKIGKSTFIGSASSIADGISIGSNVVIGLGSVITKDVPDNSMVIGNPMRFVKSINI